MVFFSKMIDVVTLGSDRPLQRLTAYYLALFVTIGALLYLVPITQSVFFGTEVAQSVRTPQLLQDGLSGVAMDSPVTSTTDQLNVTVITLLSFVMSLLFMLPVSWVYMSTAKSRTHSQDMAQTLLVLPLVVAGVVLVVQNSLALAFSLAGVVAAVRFRTNLSETRDVVFIFVAIAVGFAAGVKMLMLGGLTSLVVNIVLLLVWRYDFGRNVLAPTANAELAQSLGQIASGNGKPAVPDRDLVLALTPTKADELVRQFQRVRYTLGSKGKKPRYDAVVSITAHDVNEARRRAESAFEQVTKRWKLDEIVSNTGKPSELYYLIRPRKDVTRDAIITLIRERSNGTVEAVDVEMGVALAEERAEQRELRKLEQTG